MLSWHSLHLWLHGPGKISLIAKSILLMDALQLHSHTHKVAVDGQVCFSRWWISKCQSQPVTWDCSLASLLSSSVVYIGYTGPPGEFIALEWTNVHTHACIHTRTYTHVHTHTHTHIHTQVHMQPDFPTQKQLQETRHVPPAATMQHDPGLIMFPWRSYTSTFNLSRNVVVYMICKAI